MKLESAIRAVCRQLVSPSRKRACYAQASAVYAACTVVENDTLYFVRTDHMGRPVFATNGTGTKVWEISYLPFGEVQTSTGSPMNLRFPGQWFWHARIGWSGLIVSALSAFGPSERCFLAQEVCIPMRCAA